MSRRWMTGCELVLVCLLLTSAGCLNKTAPRAPQAEFDPAAGVKAMEMYDTNKDGKISGEELDKCPAIKAALSRIDPTGQNIVTADAIDARVQKWIESKLACRPYNCMITHNGQPFAGATVTFIPEKFLGDKVPKATGKTGKDGRVSISLHKASPTDPQGVGPGFYRIVITKEGVSIPDKYSTEAGAVFGDEVARDTTMVSVVPITFDMKF